MKYLLIAFISLVVIGCDSEPNYEPIPEAELQMLTAAKYAYPREACFHITVHGKKHKDLEGNYCMRAKENK